jgi:hypothetical protein
VLSDQQQLTPEQIDQEAKGSLQTEQTITTEPPIAIEPPTYTQLSLPIQAEAGWRIGGGDVSFARDNGDKVPDLLPVSEIIITWDNNEATSDDESASQEVASIQYRQSLLPASAVKGALSHRLAFHYRRLTQDYIEKQAPVFDDQGNKVPYNHQPHTECTAVKALFGSASDHSGDESDGEVGNWLMDDLYFDWSEENVARQMHNKIDHYTGGVIKGALFEEEMFWKTKLMLNMTLINVHKLESNVLKAFKATLEDLSRGWLPLGAGGGRGLGVFIGQGGNPDDLEWKNSPIWDDSSAQQETVQ